MLGRHLAEIDGGVVAHVEHQQVGRRAVRVVSHRPVEQRDDLVLLRAVDHDRGGRAAGLADALHDLVDLGSGATGHQHVIALFRKAATRGRAETALGAHA